MTLQKMPSTLRLALWLLGKVQGEGKIDFGVKVAFKPNDEEQQPFEATSSQIEILVSDPYREVRQEFQLALPGIPVTFPGPGTLTVNIKQPGETEYQLLAKKLVMTADGVSTEPQQPS